MKPLSLAMLLAAVVLLGLRLRLDGPGDLGSGALAAAPGSPEAERDAWRLRLVELAHAGGRAAETDRHLGIGAVPWPPLHVRGLAARGAHHVDDVGQGPVELRGEVARADELLLRVPGDLSGHGEHPAGAGGQHAVGVAAGGLPTLGLDRLEAGGLGSRSAHRGRV